ncbi:MAG: hypothetical protein A2Y33_08240 [Spirochaetes bacterium GWF1_51_8]|nr:MAG: hypothetical protein A2Y33_08240 [Spirochaetes bacterium GWF1_51_8]
MKRNVIAVLLFCLTTGLYGGEKVWYGNGDKLTVLMLTGLNLRQKPDIGGKVVVQVPYGETVTVLDDGNSPVPFTFDNIKGHWVYAEWNGHKGYVFDGFLSALPAPPVIDGGPCQTSMLGTHEIMHSYFGMLGETEIPVNDTAVVDGKKVPHFSAKFEFGIEEDIYFYENSVETLILLQSGANGYYTPYRMEEVFLLIQACGLLPGYFPLPVKSMSASDKTFGFSVLKKDDRIILSKKGQKITLIDSVHSVHLWIEETSEYLAEHEFPAPYNGD